MQRRANITARVGLLAVLGFLPASSSSAGPAHAAGASGAGPNLPRRHLRRAPAPAADLFVATDGCDDCGWSGRIAAPDAADSDGPFASIGRAQLAVRALKPGRASGAISIMIRGGTYSLGAPLAFAIADSGSPTAPVVWQAYPGETPVVNGGIRMTGWTNASGNLWRATLPPATVPFEDLYYNGERRMRPRVGAGPGNVVGTFLRVASEIYSPVSSPACPILVGGEGYKCLDRLQYAAGDPISDAWSNLTPPAGNPCGVTAGARTAPAGDVEVDLFEAWTMEKMRVSCVDTASRTIYFTASMPGLATLPFSRGPQTGHRYLVENVADLLQQPGQWFVDRSATPWKLAYLAREGEDPNADTVIAPQVQPLLSANQLTWVTFSGITFEMDDYVPGPSGFNQDENGENYLPAAVDCESCQNVVFDGVTVRHTSASGIQIASISDSAGPPAAHDAVRNSALYDIGDSGIHIGHHPSGSDRAASQVQDVLVENNVIAGYSRVFADGEGIAQGNGHDITYTHNDITDGYHAGISVCNLGCPSGDFNIVSSYNHIWNVIQGITADGGTLYYNTGNASFSGAGNQILHNLVHDVTDSSIVDAGVKGSGYGGHGIYLDAQTAGVLVEGNVVYRVAGSAIFETEGPAPGQPPNTINNNVFAFGRQGMFSEQQPWPQGCSGATLRDNITNNVFYFDRDDTSGFYVVLGCAYSCGLPYNQFQSFEGNLYWRTDGLFASYGRQFHVNTTPPANCNGSGPGSWTFLTLSQWQGTPVVGGAPMAMLEDRGSVIADPGFADPAYPFDDFTLAASPVAGFDPGLTNDTIRNAGRSNPAIVPPSVPATFPTFHYDPAKDF